MRALTTAIAAAGLLASALAARAEPARYAIDQDHTYAGFAIDHFGASVNRARFNKASGHIEFDPVARSGSVDVSVRADTVDSGSKSFDRHLRAPELFDAARHPTLRFVSQRLVFEGDRLVEVPGQLTLRGQTHPVTLKARQFSCYDSPMAKTQACGGDFEAVIDRTQWGMDYAVDMGIARNVTISATVEAHRQGR